MVKFPKFFSLTPVEQFLIAVLLITLSYAFIQLIIAGIEYFTGSIANPVMKLLIVAGVSLVGLLLLGVNNKKIREKVLG